MNTVESKTTTPGAYPQTVTVRQHVLASDYSEGDTAPGPHDYLDAALATCKTLTAIWYAKRHGIPLERADSRVERDDSEERKGVYRLRVHVELFGPLTDDQRAAIQRAILACPIHKLLTTTDVQIETV